MNEQKRAIKAPPKPRPESMRLDRPELREKIKKAVEKAGRVKPYLDTPDVFKCFYDLDVLYNELLALIPDKKAIEAYGELKYDEGLLDGIGQGEKQGRERIRADILAIDYSSSNPLDYWGQITRLAEALKEKEGGKKQ